VVQERQQEAQQLLTQLSEARTQNQHAENAARHELQALRVEVERKSKAVVELQQEVRTCATHSASPGFCVMWRICSIMLAAGLPCPAAGVMHTKLPELHLGGCIDRITNLHMRRPVLLSFARYIHSILLACIW
jgi:hypothetical protein